MYWRSFLSLSPEKRDVARLERLRELAPVWVRNEFTSQRVPLDGKIAAASLLPHNAWAKFSKQLQLKPPAERLPADLRFDEAKIQLDQKADDPPAKLTFDQAVDVVIQYCLTDPSPNPGPGGMGAGGMF